MQATTSRATLADVAFPYTGGFELWGRRIPASLIRDIVLVIGFAALVALCGRVRFYIPDADFAGLINPTPVTLQTFGVLLAGATLGSVRGVSSLVLFYLVGMAGLPVFQGGNNGWEYVTSSPTGGYLIGFVAAAFVTGFLVERGLDRKGVLWALLAGTALIYIPGVLWLGARGVVPWESVLSKGLYLFIPGDVLKLLMVGIVLPSAWAVVNLRDRRS